MGIFNKILGSILTRRTKTVAKMLGNDPELQRLAKNVNKATDVAKTAINTKKVIAGVTAVGSTAAFVDIAANNKKL